MRLEQCEFSNVKAEFAITQDQLEDSVALAVTP